MSNVKWPPATLNTPPEPSAAQPAASVVVSDSSAPAPAADTTNSRGGSLFTQASVDPRDPKQALRREGGSMGSVADLGQLVGTLSVDWDLLDPQSQGLLRAACRYPAGDEAMCLAFADGLAPFDFPLTQDTAGLVLEAAKQPDDPALAAAGHSWVSKFIS